MAWIEYNSTSYPVVNYQIDYSTVRSGRTITVNFTINSRITTSGGFVNTLGPVVFEAGLSSGTTASSVVIKNRSGDNWTNAQGTRTRYCSMSFDDLGTGRQIFLRITSGDFTNGGMPQQAPTIYFPAVALPSAPPWVSISPNPCEVNTNYIITWGASAAGSLPIVGYDIEVRAWNGSSWTNWLRIANARPGTSYNEVTPRQMNVYGVSGAPGVKFQYRIAASDGVTGTSGWSGSPELNLTFISPTAPTTFTLNPSTSIKKEETVKITWSGATGGSGTITTYTLEFRKYTASTSTWGSWGNSFTTSSTTYTWNPLSMFGTFSNGDMIQARIKTNNSWSYSSGYVNSSNLPVRTNIAWLNVNGVWYEATPYININGVWYEATPYINVSGVWYEST